MDVDTNVNSKMSSLVHHAEEGVVRDGLNAVPEVSLEELKRHQIGRQIVTRAALLLMEQLRIKSAEDYTIHFGGQKNEEKQNVMSPVSPMPIEEFQSILKNGWPVDEPLTNSPFGTKRRTSLLAELIPLSPVLSETFAVPKLPARKSDPTPHIRKLFSTPQSKMAYRRTSSMSGTPATNRTMRYETITTATSTPKLCRQSPTPTGGETPMENRASRLRRLKIEEKRRSAGGEHCNPMNSSFGWK